MAQSVKAFERRLGTEEGGSGFKDPLPLSYESEFYPSSLSAAQRRTTAISEDYVIKTTLPKWRTNYPQATRWGADIEWQNSGGVTAAEVKLILPAFTAARKFFAAEGKGVKIGAYNVPPRFGTGRDPGPLKAQIEILRPIIDLLDEAHVTLYPIYTDINQSRVYFQENIEMARWAMPGKPVQVFLWPAWHNNVNPDGKDPSKPMPGSPVSRAWWRMALEEAALKADGVAIWLMAAAPKPSNEPWWLETQAWLATRG